jgi:hypothetical protein
MVNSAERALERVRSFLLALFLAGSTVMLAELLLSEHSEDINQFIPIGLLLASMLVCAFLVVWPSRGTERLFRVLMLGSAASGLLGVYLHLSAKAEFALERQPDLVGWKLFVESLEGSSPPILAPLAMCSLALIGFAWSLMRRRAVAPAHPDTITTEFR